MRLRIISICVKKYQQLAHKGSSNEARVDRDYKPALRAKTHISTFTIAKMLWGYCQGYDPRVSQGAN
jgi:hypothetical protein